MGLKRNKGGEKLSRNVNHSILEEVFLLCSAACHLYAYIKLSYFTICTSSLLFIEFMFGLTPLFHTVDNLKVRSYITLTIKSDAFTDTDE